MTQNEPRLFGLDLLRVLLCLTVMAAHYLLIGPWDHAAWPRLDLPGFVYSRYTSHTFFIISGFCIFYALGERTAFGFALARMQRLWPALLICPALTWALVRHAFEASPGFQQVAMSMGVVPLALGRGTGADWSYWTMTIEVRFYIMVGLALLLFDARRRGLWLIGALLALEIWDLLEPGNFIVHELGLSWYGPFFIMGALTYVIWSRPGRARLVAVLMMPTAWILAGGEVINEWTDNHKGVWAYFPDPDLAKLLIPAAALLLVVAALLVSKAFEPGPKARRIITFLGAATYPLYLLHQMFGYRIINDLTPRLPAGMTWLAPLAAALASTSIAIGITLLWQKPVERVIGAAGSWLASKTGLRLTREPAAGALPASLAAAK